MPNQAEWRFCQNCHCMFFHGFNEFGVCPKGGQHSPAGFTFNLPFDEPLTGQNQEHWRFCAKCFSMFFNEKLDNLTAVCAKDHGLHAKGGSVNFVLPFGPPGATDTATAQANWRFCAKCFVMFFAGFDGGVCAKDGGSHFQGGSVNFVLPHLP